MSASIRWTVRSALLSSLVLVCSFAAAGAAPSAPKSAEPSPPDGAITAIEKAADRTAVQDLQQAVTMLKGNDRRAARDLFERAETALLNREVLDLGPALRVDQPLPATPAIQRIKQAEKGLQEARRTQAIDAAEQARAALAAELAPRKSI